MGTCHRSLSDEAHAALMFEENLVYTRRLPRSVLLTQRVIIRVVTHCLPSRPSKRYAQFSLSNAVRAPSFRSAQAVQAGQQCEPQ